MKKVMVVNDSSALGNCSLTANVAVFSAMGMEPLIVPTAVLTNQSCYTHYSAMDYAVDFSAFATRWKQANQTPDGIYSGYFCTPTQMDAFRLAFLENKGDTPYINDPVMGDLGTQYDNCSAAMVTAMKELVRLSTVTTPNLTELCLLTDTPYQPLVARQLEADYLTQISAIAKALLEQGTKQVVVTGVKWKGDSLYNILATRHKTVPIATQQLPGDFSGTGDLFSSILCGCVLRGNSLEQGIKKATDLIEAAIVFDETQKRAGNDGICFQPFLHLLQE